MAMIRMQKSIFNGISNETINRWWFVDITIQPIQLLEWRPKQLLHKINEKLMQNALCCHCFIIRPICVQFVNDFLECTRDIRIISCCRISYHPRKCSVHRCACVGVCIFVIFPLKMVYISSGCSVMQMPIFVRPTLTLLIPQNERFIYKDANEKRFSARSNQQWSTDVSAKAMLKTICAVISRQNVSMYAPNECTTLKSVIFIYAYSF